MFLRIFIGLIMAAVGFLMVKRPDGALELIGQIGFAEKLFGGGSYTFFQILGVLIIAIGFLVILNMHYLVLNGIYNFLF